MVHDPPVCRTQFYSGDPDILFEIRWDAAKSLIVVSAGGGNGVLAGHGDHQVRLADSPSVTNGGNGRQILRIALLRPLIHPGANYLDLFGSEARVVSELAIDRIGGARRHFLTQHSLANRLSPRTRRLGREQGHGRDIVRPVTSRALLKKDGRDVSRESHLRVTQRLRSGQCGKDGKTLAENKTAGRHSDARVENPGHHRSLFRQPLSLTESRTSARLSLGRASILPALLLRPLFFGLRYPRVAHTASPTCSVVAGAPVGLRSAVTVPLPNTTSMAELTAAASSCKPKLYSSSAATEPMDPRGLARFCPAMSGAEPCTGSYRPTHAPDALRPPSDADGSMPIDPASTAPSSLRMSPNIFSVSTTSKRRGFKINCIAQLSTSR